MPDKKFIIHDDFTYDFRKIQPVEDKNFNGDYFPEDTRYRGRLVSLQRLEDPESGWQFIEAQIRCVKAQDPEMVGKTLRQTFTIPDEDKLAAAEDAHDEKKINSLLYPLRKYHTMCWACGHPKLEIEATIKFAKLIDDEFEFTTVDYKPDDRVKTFKGLDGKPVTKTLKREVQSQLNKMYRVGATTVANIDTPEPTESKAEEVEGW